MKSFKSLALAALISHGLLAALPAAADETIDVMVLYTDEMLEETADADTRIALMISWMNNALSQSDVAATINLVHSQKINFNNDHQTNGAALDALQANSDVATLRQTHGADMVALITTTGPYCGIAYVPLRTEQNNLQGKDYAFSVVGSLCIDTFAHELGHNMGLGHSAAQGSQGSIYSWARGHGVNNTFVTTMAYQSAYNAPFTVQRFSNPEINTCSELACGVDLSQSNGADAARNLNQVANEVAGYLAANGGDSGDDGGDADGDDLSPPSEPAGLSITTIQSNSISLSWIASSDNVGVDHYQIFRDNIAIGTTNQTRYDDGGLNSNTIYQYHVLATDAANNTSNPSNSLLATTLEFDTPTDAVAPTTPKRFKVRAGINNIQLSWKAATDNIATTGYLVFRDGIEIASTATTSYTDNDSTLAQQISYYYEVKAVDAAGNRSDATKLKPGRLKRNTKATHGAGSDPQNILINGHFNSLDGWIAVEAALKRTRNSTAGKGSLLIKRRSTDLSGVLQVIDQNLLEENADYLFQADIRLGRNRTSAPIVAVLDIPTTNGWQTQLLASTYIQRKGWQRLTSSFTLAHQATGEAYLYFYGPNARTSIRLDEVLLKKVNSPSASTLEQHRVINNPDFEHSIDGWESYADASLIWDTDAYKGNGAAKLSHRHSAYSGLAQRLATTLLPGANYHLSAAMKHTGSNRTQPLKLYLYYQTAEQASGQWIPLAEAPLATSDTWTQLTGSLTLPDSPIRQAYLLAFGPDKNVDLQVDEVTLTLVD
jgi:chitodextrinase